jgi:hypothetical protein
MESSARRGEITPTQPSPIEGEGFQAVFMPLPLDGGGLGGGDAGAMRDEDFQPAGSAGLIGVPWGMPPQK